MKSLLIGEVSNGSLSAGTLEIISKLQENSLEFNLVVIGSEEGPSIGSDSFDVTYIKVNPDALSLSAVADKISEKINSDGIELVLASSTYVGRDISGFLSPMVAGPSQLNRKASTDSDSAMACNYADR